MTSLRYIVVRVLLALTALPKPLATFCLLEAGAAEGLLRVLESNRERGVVEAAAGGGTVTRRCFSGRWRGSWRTARRAVREVTSDRALPSLVVSAFHKGATPPPSRSPRACSGACTACRATPPPTNPFDNCVFWVKNHNGLNAVHLA